MTPNVTLASKKTADKAAHVNGHCPVADSTSCHCEPTSDESLCTSVFPDRPEDDEAVLAWHEVGEIRRRFGQLNELEAALRGGVAFAITSAKEREDLASYLSWEWLGWTAPSHLDPRADLAPTLKGMGLEDVPTAEASIADLGTLSGAQRTYWLGLIAWIRKNDPFTEEVAREEAIAAERHYLECLLAWAKPRLEAVKRPAAMQA